MDYLHTSHVFGTARKPYEMPIEADFGVHSSGHDPRQGLQKKELTTQGHIVSKSTNINFMHCGNPTARRLPEIPADTAATNPILRPVTDGLPALDVITERQAFYGLGKAILQYESEVTQMEERCREALDQGRVPDFDEIFAPLERARVNFDGVWRICNMLHMTTDTIEGDRAIALHRRANKAANGVTGSEVIFDALCKMKEAHDKGERELDAERLRIVERQIAMMKSAGYGMPAKKREALKACMYRFDEPNTQYNYKTEVREGNPAVTRHSLIDYFSVANSAVSLQHLRPQCRARLSQRRAERDGHGPRPASQGTLDRHPPPLLVQKVPRVLSGPRTAMERVPRQGELGLG